MSKRKKGDSSRKISDSSRKKGDNWRGQTLDSSSLFNTIKH
jgi:hypothetical protein